MLNEIMIGIAQKLNQVFGGGYKTHINKVQQGLKEPCFLIVNLTGDQVQEIGNLYNWDQSFDIHYFPQSNKRITSEINSVIDALRMELEYITVDGDLVRGTKMKHEVVNDVLHFFVSYNMRVRKVVEPDPAMETITINEEVKVSGE
jgi:hypothetical protein